MLHTIAIQLKIPDNTAYSALTALKRLGVGVDRVARADIWQFDAAESAEEIAQRVKLNESMFNPNKHVLETLNEASPREGEAWIEQIDPPNRPREGKHFTSWRLFAKEKPVDAQTLRTALSSLLCNSAIERAITSPSGSPFDDASHRSGSFDASG